MQNIVLLNQLHEIYTTVSNCSDQYGTSSFYVLHVIFVIFILYDVLTTVRLTSDSSDVLMGVLSSGHQHRAMLSNSNTGLNNVLNGNNNNNNFMDNSLGEILIPTYDDAKSVEFKKYKLVENKNERKEKCDICWEEFTHENKYIIEAHCCIGKKLHVHCAYKSIRSQETCPFCRQHVEIV